MALSLVNNVASLNAGNNLTRTNSALGKSLERLSTGLKVNRGADGPAALVISEQQRAQITGLKTAIDNTNKAVALVQTGEGALNEINSLLTKARSLALDSANGGINDANSYAANQAELNNIVKTVNNIANQTQFGQKKLLDGSGDSQALTTSVAGATFGGRAGVALETPAGNPASYQFNVTAGAKSQTAGSAALAVTGATTFSVQVGSTTATASLATGDSVDVVAGKINAALKSAGVTTVQATNGFNGAGAGNLFLTATDFTTDFTSTVGTPANLTGFTGAAATHTDAVVSYTDSLGAVQNAVVSGNIATFNGELNGVTLTLGQSGGTINSIAGAVTANAGEAFKFQIGANSGQTESINFRRVTSESLGAVGADSLATARIDSDDDAQKALAVIDQAINDVSNLRGELGAFQSNTLETNANNLRVGLENTTAAESVIRDTDFASEIATFTKQQTLLQAGSTVLGNANQITQLVAGLLRG